MAAPITLGPTRGLYQPGYELRFFADGDPSKRIRSDKVDLRTITAIQTSKSIGDLAGTFTIVLKDGRAQHAIREMDVVRIRLRGHGDNRMVTVLKGVVDSVRQTGSATPQGSEQTTTITGRCVGKYLQVTSLFLPVWDPASMLPTALTFGLGDAAKKVGDNRPYDIFRYLVRKYTYGENDRAGLSGIPNSRHWLDHYTRFARKSLDFRVPFLQLDEVSVADALKRMEVLGFTETWIDELGRIVYRHPGWDRPVQYRLSTSELIDHDFSRSDVDIATYVEVVPAGDPGIDSGTAQALRAGRAPVPSSYLTGSSGPSGVGESFIVETDSKGRPTAKGRRNHWYRLQRRLGLRPQQVESPLIFTQQQAQKQAEGLLQFFTRATKTATLTIPGNPLVRLGYTINVFGVVDGKKINRTYYIEDVRHDYSESPDGGSYTTTLYLTHGRDPWDPKWKQISLPTFDPQDLAYDANGGTLKPAPGSSGGRGTLGPGELKGLSPKEVIDRVVLPLARKAGVARTVAENDAANAHHGPTSSGNRSDHQGPPDRAWATDLPVDKRTGDKLARVLADAFGFAGDGAGSFTRVEHDGFSFQLLWQVEGHYDHVHFGVQKL